MISSLSRIKMSDKFCLNWTDYQSNWNRSLSELRNENDLADVTLISDDKVKFSAHKVLLSSCSNMFKFILKSNTNTNPLLFLGGVSSVNLGFILDYIYNGEVKIFQEQLDSFLESAQKLEIEGLLGNREDNEENINTETEKHHDNNIEQPKKEHTQYQSTQERQMARMNDNTVLQTRRQFVRSRSSTVKKIDVASLNSEEIKDKLKELYEKIDGFYSCLPCDYTTRDESNMRKHVEIHLEGLCYTCNICSKEFRSRNILNVHKTNFHKKLFSGPSTV